MANATFKQVYDANAFLTIADTDIFPAVRSPYGSGDDGGIDGAAVKEAIRDTVAAFVVNGSNISVTHDDISDTLTIAYTGTEYTDADARAAVESGVNNLGFSASPTVTPNEGDLWYDGIVNHCLQFQDDETDSTLQIGQESWLRAYNDSGAQIDNGKVVYASGTDTSENGRLEIALARANAENTSAVLGLATHDIANGSVGRVVQFGYADGIDTSSFTANEALYLSPDTAGELTNVRPQSPNVPVYIGRVVSVGVSGRIFITALGNTSGDNPVTNASEVTVPARKGTAGTINKGQPVYITGYNVGQDAVEVELAAANASSTMPAIGISNDSITNAATGNVVLSGRVAGIDTSSWAVNDTLYVSTTSGVLTNTKPVGSAQVQAVARVERVNASNGIIQVIGAGRVNDVPNFSAADKFWYGGTSGVVTEGNITAAGRALIDDANDTAQRATLGLGTAALKNTGTFGDAVPLLANAGNLVFSFTTAGAGFSITNTNSTTSVASPVMGLTKSGYNGVTNDNLGTFNFFGPNNAGTTVAAGNISCVTTTPTAGAESFRYGFITRQGGTVSGRMTVGAGIQVGAPTGGDLGTGTLNAVGVYDDNTLLTCYVFDEAINGAIDLEKWDGKVPDRIIPAEYEILPLYDDPEHPNRMTGTRTVLISPERVEQREHLPLRKFMNRKGTEYDPLTLDGYAKHWREKLHLTAMPNEATYDTVNGRLTTGEWIQRLVETVEVHAILKEKMRDEYKAEIVRLEGLIQALSSRLEVVEGRAR